MAEKRSMIVGVVVFQEPYTLVCGPVLKLRGTCSRKTAVHF